MKYLTDKDDGFINGVLYIHRLATKLFNQKVISRLAFFYSDLTLETQTCLMHTTDIVHRHFNHDRPGSD